jgi:hypothetical protein
VAASHLRHHRNAYHSSRASQSSEGEKEGAGEMIYPTAWAYEATCKALEKHRARANVYEEALKAIVLLSYDKGAQRLANHALAFADETSRPIADPNEMSARFDQLIDKIDQLIDSVGKQDDSIDD